MKKFLKLLVTGATMFALLCCVLPAAFAADSSSTSKREENVYSISLDAQGGTCANGLLVYTSPNGKLESTPEQPVMSGYTFDGWYTEPVGGSKVSTSTVFTSDTTIYAHWTVKNASTTPTQPSAQPGIQWQNYAGPALTVGALVTTLLIASLM